jgi:cytochrome c-type biogenesis protein CcmH/NrfF
MRPNCHGHTEQTARILQHIDEGKDRDAILAAFVQEFGSQAVLARPVDRGFNRLAWMFPYLVAGVALVGIVLTARRWSRGVTPPATDASVDPGLDARLDDELRNLD